MDLIAIRIGVPKPILTLDGTDTNKATMRELMKDLMYDIRADELKVRNVIEQQIFGPACANLYGEEFDLIPTFQFNEFDEGREEKATIVNMTSEYVKRFTDSYKLLKEAGAEDAAKEILDYMLKNIPIHTEPDKKSDEIVE